MACDKVRRTQYFYMLFAHEFFFMELILWMYMHFNLTWNFSRSTVAAVIRMNLYNQTTWFARSQLDCAILFKTNFYWRRKKGQTNKKSFMEARAFCPGFAIATIVDGSLTLSAPFAHCDASNFSFQLWQKRWSWFTTCEVFFLAQFRIEIQNISFRSRYR